jgi:hypothetical protein
MWNIKLGDGTGGASRYSTGFGFAKMLRLHIGTTVQT